MRRSDRAVTDAARMLDIVAACDCCRIGLVDQGRAYIVPMSFGYTWEGERLTLYFHSANDGRKLDLLRAAPSVSFEMDTAHELTGVGDVACHYSTHYASVMGEGEARVLSDEAEKAHALSQIMAHYAPSRAWTFPPASLSAVTVIALTVTSWSCKANLKKRYEQRNGERGERWGAAPSPGRERVPCTPPSASRRIEVRVAVRASRFRGGVRWGAAPSPGRERVPCTPASASRWLEVRAAVHAVA